MNIWRVIITDSEEETGIAPECDVHNDSDVYDCCPGPHIECGTRFAARTIADALTATNAGVIS